MKQKMYAAAVCGCLLIGSLYPRLLLQRHLKLVDAKGNVTEADDEINPDIPLRLEFKLPELLKSLL